MCLRFGFLVYVSYEIRVYGRSTAQLVRTPCTLTCCLNLMSINIFCKLTNVKSHRQKDDQSKPTIESHNKVDNCHSDISKSRDDVKQKIATVQNKKKHCLNSTIKKSLPLNTQLYTTPSCMKLRPINVTSCTLTGRIAGHEICNV